MFLALAKRSFDGMRAVLVAVAAVVSLFQVAVVLQAASFDRQQLLQTLGRMLPAFVERWLGENIVTLGSFGGMVALGYFHPVVVLLVAIATAFVASDPAADVEEGYVDLLLSRPLARHWLITRSAALAVACPLILGALMMAATWTTIALVARPAAQAPSARTIVILAAHLAAVAWCFGALSLALASAARRRNTPLGSAAVAAVGLYLIDVLAASWEPARVVDVLSPFHYYRGTEILAGVAHSVRDLAVLASTSVVLIAVAYWNFNARDF
ncbi:MAG TPA: hypothetical protein VMS04_18775 [Vicinamibacterales bacterium]|nr:hypothetical protein [Vicinamibacterales bacterium]